MSVYTCINTLNAHTVVAQFFYIFLSSYGVAYSLRIFIQKLTLTEMGFTYNLKLTVLPLTSACERAFLKVAKNIEIKLQGKNKE